MTQERVNVWVCRTPVIAVQAPLELGHTTPREAFKFYRLWVGQGWQ